MAAEWNDFGVSGIASGVKLVVVSVSKSLTSSDYSYDSIIKGYDFLIRCVEAGVDIRVVNRSLNMRPATNANDVMVQAAGEVGIVTCIASGNEHDNLDDLFTDASYLQPSPYIVRINASSSLDGRAPFSNYGAYITDLFAPGVSILSTMPSNQESMSRYFVEADADVLYHKTDFSNGILEVLSGDEVEIVDVSEGSIGVDGDGSSLKVGVSMQAGSYGEVHVLVPVGALSIDDVQDISVAFNMGNNEARYANLGILLEDGTYSDEYDNVVMNLSDGGSNGWVFARLHFTDSEALGQDVALVPDSQGNPCIQWPT